MQDFRSLVVTVQKVDTFACDVPAEMSCAVSTSGGAMLDSGLRIKDDAMFETNFDSMMTFPFDVAKDKTLTLALKDKAGQVLGAYALEMKLLLERDTSPSMQCKLRHPVSKQPVCILRASLRLSGTLCEGNKPVCVKVERNVAAAAALEAAEAEAPNVLLQMNNTPDIVQKREESGIVTNSIELQLYHIADFLDEADEVAVRMGEYRHVLKMEGRNVNASMSMQYKGERFIKFELLNRGQAMGLGAIDLTKFVTHRANVIGGSLSIEDVESIAGRKNCLGVLYFRMQRFASDRKDGFQKIDGNESYASAGLPA